MKKHPTISQKEFDARLSRTQDAISETGLDGLIIFSRCPDQEGAVSYFSNFRQGYLARKSGGEVAYSALIIRKSGLCTLIAQSGPIDGNLVNINETKQSTAMAADLISVLRENSLTEHRVGVAGLDIIPAGIWQSVLKTAGKVEFVPAENLLNDARSRKSSQEITQLTKSALVARATISSGINAAQAGTSEIQVELAMRRKAYEEGADLVFWVGVQSGPRLESRNRPMVSDRFLQDGDFLKLQISGWASGYAFSKTKTIVVGSAASEQLVQLSHLDDVADWMVQTLQPNAEVSYVLTMHKNQRIEPAAHGIGLDLREAPWIPMGAVAQKPIVSPGAVLQIEPVLMDAMIGAISVSKTVLITETGPKVLGET